MLPNSTFLINYAIVLAIGYYFISNSISRLVTITSLLLILALNFLNHETIGIMAILIVYLFAS